MKAAAEELTRLQELMAPLAYAAFDSERVYAEVQRRIKSLERLGVDDLLLGTIDLQARIILGIEEGDANSAMGCLHNEIADWKHENCPE